jgi:hypothetical protein
MIDFYSIGFVVSIFIFYGIIRYYVDLLDHTFNISSSFTQDSLQNIV